MQKISLLLAVTLFAVSCGSSSSGNQIAFDRSSFDSRIAFLSGYQHNLSSEILVMNPDRSNYCGHSVPTGRQFSWSPDGSRIAFNVEQSFDDPAWTTNPSSGGEIFVMYADCTGIYSTGQKGHSFDWSPDGSQIVFANTGNHSLNFLPDANPISVMNADGSGVYSLGVKGCFPKWSPDGSQLAFIGRDGDEILVINADLAKAPQYINKKIQGDFGCRLSHGENFSWSPDGSQIAFEDSGTIFLRNMTVDFGDSFNLNRATGTGRYYPLTESWEDANTYNPKWSPDGSQIAAWISGKHRSSGDIGAGIVVMDTDGTSAHDLTAAIGSACVKCTGAYSDLTQSLSYYFSWSPDGSQIVFSYSYWDAASDSDRIFVINADGTDLYSLETRGWNPKWSPDG